MAFAIIPTPERRVVLLLWLPWWTVYDFRLTATRYSSHGSSHL